ncbi:MAG TPA: SLBB domain-containing protein, partial [Candidatus Limnocylindrales bacterium]|nr:SLBB domain-containing protein [Candidatus Limnocylindrales bacterium]
MALTLPEAAHRAGIVGGGSGAAVAPKLLVRADLVIANAAECVPLAASDLAVLEAHPGSVLRAFHEVLAALDAKAGVLAISERALGARDSVLRELKKFSGISIVPVRDFYPAGDAHVLTGEVLGHAAPRTDPHAVSVLNVRTLNDLAAAKTGAPVTHRDVTVTGAVANPGVFRLPLGASVRSAIVAAGDATDATWVALAGNPMTAIPVTAEHALAKSDSLVVVLPATHPLVKSRAIDEATRRARTFAGCDGCGACADLCPRTAGDASLRPDLVVRALLHGKAGRSEWLDAARACSGCGV